MHAVRWIALVSATVITLASATAQPRKVEVVGLDGRDLERSAHHLGTTVEQVRQTRELLEKATDLALQSDLNSSWPSLTPLAWLWRRAHPRKAVATTDKLLDHLKSTARKTSDPEAYRWCGAEAHALIQAMYESPTRLEEFLEDWPRRSDFGEEVDDGLSALSEQLRNERVLLTADQDPAAAAELLRSDGDSSGFVYADVARSLERRGQSDAARRLVLERLAWLQNAPDSPENTQQLFELLHSLAIGPSDLLISALEVFNSREWTLPGAYAAVNLVLENNRGSVQLDPRETALYVLLRSLSESPEAALRALETQPGLKAKLQKLGGLDQAMRADIITPDETGQPRHISQDPRQYRQFRYQWGEADTHPSEVRRRLAAILPSGLDWTLFSPVQSHCVSDPAFSRIGLDLLTERFRQSQDLAFRLKWLPPLLQAHYQCEGKVDRPLIEEGFRLLDEPGDSAKGDAAPQWPGDQRSELERRLLIEWSRLDFDAASEYVRQIEDASEKFKVYVAMAESRIGQ